MARTSSVRVAKVEDIPAVIDIGQRFHQETVYGQIADLDDETLVERLSKTIARDGIVFVAESGGEIVGTAGAIITTPWFNKHQKIALELMWWVNPEARGCGAGSALFDALDNWSLRLGLHLVMMRTPNIAPQVMDRLYRMKGLVPWDSYYVKLRKAA